MLLQCLFIITCKPKDNLINFCFCTAFFLGLLNIVWVHTYKRHFINSGVFHYIEFYSSIASIPCALRRSSPSFMALTCSGECPFQTVTSPTTLKGCSDL